MNYTTLQADLAEYLDRSDLTSRIQEFIELAEKRIMFDLKFRGTEVTLTPFTITSGTDTYALPADFRAMVVLLREDRTVIPIRTMSFVDKYDAELTISSGPPAFAAIYNDNLKVTPTPDQNYDLTMRYFEEVEALGASNATNYFTDNTPNLLLYASLLEAAPYLHNDDRVPLWQAYYDRFVASIMGEDSVYNTSRSGD